MITPLLEVQGLKVHFPIRGALPWITAAEVHAVNGVDLRVYKGETLGIVGESGCGKTTLGSAILGLQSANSGQINFDGSELSLNAHADDRIGMQVIFQDPFASLNPRRKVWKTVGEPLLVTGVQQDEVRVKVTEVIKSVGLQTTHLDRLPHEFSGGQRQRLAIARALVRRPKLVVCDEPVSALDVSVQAHILNLLKDLQDEMNLTMLFISHDLPVIRQMCDRVAVMRHGAICEIATTNSLFDEPKHEYSKHLLDLMPKINFLTESD